MVLLYKGQRFHQAQVNLLLNVNPIVESGGNGIFQSIPRILQQFILKSRVIRQRSIFHIQSVKNVKVEFQSYLRSSTTTVLVRGPQAVRSVEQI